MPKIKDKENLKSSKRKAVSYLQGSSHRVINRGASVDFSTETLQVRRDGHKIFKVIKNKDLQPRLLYPATLSFRIKGQLKNFTERKG